MPSRTIEESHRPRVSDRTMHCHSSSGQSSGLLFQKTIGAVTAAKMEPQETRIHSALHTRRRIATLGSEEDHSRSVRSIGWAECREKKIGIDPKGSTFLLTFPLIGLFRFRDYTGVEETVAYNRHVRLCEMTRCALRNSTRPGFTNSEPAHLIFLCMLN